MPENRTENETARQKRTAQVLRQRGGGVPTERMERTREHNRVRRKLTEALKQGPKTVPEIAESSGLPTHEVFWHLMAMKKYGKVVEGEERGDYFEYALAEEEQQETTK